MVWASAGQKGAVVIVYRRFRNTDPPGLLSVWNDTLTGRSAYPLRTPALLERWIFSKPYFEHDALIVAEHSGTHQIVGWALAGFGPNADHTALNRELGVVCCVLVSPLYRRQGVGRELLCRAEEFLTERGAQEVVVGAMTPNNPYLFGLYGGTNSPGILASDTLADPFLRALGYAPAESRLVFQRKLDEPLTLADPRFAAVRRRYTPQHLLREATASSWWIECVWGTLEPSEVRLVDKQTQAVVARAIVWELDGFSWRWGYPSAGIYDVLVRADIRRQGLAKLMLQDIHHILEEQYFGLAELHAPADEPAAQGMARALGFQQVDTGSVYRRPKAG
ncbi:MAG: GNAT family N-acetyltransferase [Bacteroidales bacterium]|nr:GNAT family N-acetyltransferase [Bacteroidales bacterium]